MRRAYVRPPIKRLASRGNDTHFLRVSRTFRGKTSIHWVRKTKLLTGENVRSMLPVMSVYFIQAGVDGAIKIGFTRFPVLDRLKSLQVACPDELRLLAVLAGDDGKETEIHKRFAPDRIRGEWFRPSTTLLDYVYSLPQVSVPTLRASSRYLTPSYRQKAARFAVKAARKRERRKLSISQAIVQDSKQSYGSVSEDFDATWARVFGVARASLSE